jgi:hypothetical protein
MLLSISLYHVEDITSHMFLPCNVLALKVGQARKVAHDLNLAVTVKINERALRVLSARHLVVCAQEQVQGINCCLRADADVLRSADDEGRLTRKMAVFWVVAPRSLVEVYQRFRGPCCLHHQGDGHSSP